MLSSFCLRFGSAGCLKCFRVSVVARMSALLMCHCSVFHCNIPKDGAASFTECTLECLFTDAEYYKIFGSWVSKQFFYFVAEDLAPVASYLHGDMTAGCLVSQCLLYRLWCYSVGTGSVVTYSKTVW